MSLLCLRRSNGYSSTGKHRSSSDPTYEARIQMALEGLVSGLYKSVSAAARAQTVCFISPLILMTIPILQDY